MEDEPDLVRRSSLFVVGAAVLAGCATESTSAVDRVESGTDVKWVDSVLGSSFPSSRNGDLASNTGSNLGATMAFAKGCRVPGDGGGGLFYWDSNGGTDDGGFVIVPGGHVGSTGACWRRAR